MAAHVEAGIDEKAGRVAYIVTGDVNADVQSALDLISHHYGTSLTCRIDILPPKFKNGKFTAYVRISDLTNETVLRF